MADDLEDFEAFLENDFSATQFGNDLLRATNADPLTNELDIDTSIKKINYDVGEIESHIHQLINENPMQILDQISKARTLSTTASSGLRPSLEYLDMSYQRLQEEVLGPYEKAQKLQSALSKVHQTSILLRDALIYIHLVNKIKILSDSKTLLSSQKALELASLHSQLKLGIDQSANLKSLSLIKKLDADVVGPSRKELLTYLSNSLSVDCADGDKFSENREKIVTLVEALYKLASSDFSSTIQNLVLSHVAPSVQALIKTINFIKSFPSAMETAVRRGYVVHQLQLVLRDIKTENSNLLNEFTSHIKPKPLTPQEMYWSRVADGFRKELEVSYRRGGPVGKVLQKSQKFIEQTIRKNMDHSSDEDEDDYNDMQIMLGSISVLTTEMH